MTSVEPYDSGAACCLRMSRGLIYQTDVDMENAWYPYQISNIHEMHSYESGGLMVWAEIALGGRTDLRIFSGGRVTTVCYRDYILDKYVRPFLAVMGPNVILMDDLTPGFIRLASSACSLKHFLS